MVKKSSTRICSHIKVNGIRCGSPALRQEIFCYFHQRMIRGVRTPPKSRLHPIAILEDEQSIQASLMEIVNALVRNQIDINRARLILRALHIATKNARNADFELFKHEMVNEIPQYPAAPEMPKPEDSPLQQAAVLAKAARPKPRWPTDYGIAREQALEWGFPEDEIDPPRDLAETKTALSKFTESLLAAQAASQPTRSATVG